MPNVSNKNVSVIKDQDAFNADFSGLTKMFFFIRWFLKVPLSLQLFQVLKKISLCVYIKEDKRLIYYVGVSTNSVCLKDFITESLC